MIYGPVAFIQNTPLVWCCVVCCEYCVLHAAYLHAPRSMLIVKYIVLCGVLHVQLPLLCACAWFILCHTMPTVTIVDMSRAWDMSHTVVRLYVILTCMLLHDIHFCDSLGMGFLATNPFVLQAAPILATFARACQLDTCLLPVLSVVKTPVVLANSSQVCQLTKHVCNTHLSS